MWGYVLFMQIKRRRFTCRRRKIYANVLRVAKEVRRSIL